MHRPGLCLCREGHMNRCKGCPSARRNHRGVTLVEIVISMLMLALLSITVISSVIFSSRGARLNTNALAAKNIAQGWFERMAADDFGNVTPPDNTASGGIWNPTGAGYEDIPTTSATPVWLDRALGIPCAVDFAFKGFGIASGGGSSSLTDSSVSWETDEWEGDTLYLIDGTGSGQHAEITSNSATSLSIDGTFTVPPDNTTKYLINNGKTVEITTTWFYQGEPFTQTVESLIINYRNDEDFGF